MWTRQAGLVLGQVGFLVSTVQPGGAVQYSLRREPLASLADGGLVLRGPVGIAGDAGLFAHGLGRVGEVSAFERDHVRLVRVPEGSQEERVTLQILEYGL